LKLNFEMEYQDSVPGTDRNHVLYIV
jgi:hypothetical protein